MLTNQSQVIERNIDRFAQLQHLLVMSPPADQISSILPGSTVYHTTDFPIHQYLSRGESQVLLSTHVESSDDNKFDGILIFMPKSKDELRFKIANALSVLSPGGDLFLVGSKKEGIASANKVLQASGGKALKIDSARHCTLWGIKPEKAGQAFTLSDWETVYDVSVAGCNLKLCSLPGVFAHGKLDIGTTFLLESISSSLKDFKGHWLDFACGAGVIAAYLLKNIDVTAEAIDCSALAVHCTQRTFALNDINGKAYLSDGLSQLSGKKFNGVITNPPFHTGVKTDYSVTETFVSNVKAALKDGGKLFMVANNFLDYDARLQKTFGNVTTVAGNSKFNVYRSVN